MFGLGCDGEEGRFQWLCIERSERLLGGFDGDEGPLG